MVSFIRIFEDKTFYKKKEIGTNIYRSPEAYLYYCQTLKMTLKGSFQHSSA